MLQWMVQNMDTTIVQLTDIQHTNGTSETMVEVSRSRNKDSRGYAVIIKRGDDTAHLLCKEYTGITNNKNRSREFASQQHSTTDEVYRFVGNVLRATWGMHEQWWTEVTAYEQQLVMKELMGHSTVGSGLET